jgi:mono/diheme cytochrome c family protein
MGKTEELGPPPQANGDSPPWRMPVLSQSFSQSVSLGGSDLYRFNCRGCHGEKGLGAPPEIRSLINPVRATSANLVLARMKSVGMDITPPQASEMAMQARKAVTDRLQKGGESMPAFAYLQKHELSALTGYLEELSDMPGYHRVTVQESPLRVGELIVRSTCHICHDATGANPTPQQMQDGAIPPLSALTTRTTEQEFVRKVTHGWPVRVSDPVSFQRGRMPVFYYLTPGEAADAYAYLEHYPPEREQPVALASVSGPDSALPGSKSSKIAMTKAERALQEEVNSKTLVLIVALGIFVALLIGTGCAITVSEFCRLSANVEPRVLENSEYEPEVMHSYSK